ncbi:MAG: 2-dehydropantoate 2-reductase [Betaproteobacteria bacterium]|nr:2-dehydropantoate 2-reductase [Betaproteobacteria bacterium]
MKICIYGAGAIGGYMAVQLAEAGADICVIARGEHLRAIQKEGLTLLIDGKKKNVKIPASDNPIDFGPQDYVISALKAHQSHESAKKFAPLLGPDTAVVTAMNGIPWWYFYKEGGKLEGRHLESVDPGGEQWKHIGPERAIGCVVDPATEVIAPGVIEHHEFNRFILGEPDGTQSERVTQLAEIFKKAEFDAPVRDAIRWNVWLKLWGNVCFNPISALTHRTLDQITQGPLRELCIKAMEETKAVTDALNVHIPKEMMARRLDVASKAVGHKMSMLQDIERHRSMEIDALVTAVQELGRMTGVPTPTVDVLLVLVQELGRQEGLY